MSRSRIPFADSLRRLLHPRRRFLAALTLACLAALTAAAPQARAEDDVLKLVPEKALGFAVVNNPESADAKLQQLGRQMGLPIPSLLAKIEDAGISKGWDKRRPVAVLFLQPKEASPIPVSAVLLAPVDDYDKFLEQFNSNETDAGITKIQFKGPALVRKLGSYAAITAEPFREALAGLKSADEVPEALAKWQPWMAKKDAAAIVFAPGIRAISEKVQQGIAIAKMAIGGQAPEQAKKAAAALDMYVTFFKAAEKEVNSFGIAIQRNKAGDVRVCELARLVPGGSWAQFVAAAKPAEQNVLAGLPGGAFVVAGGGPFSQESMKGFMNWSFSLIKNMREMYGLTEEQADQISALREMKFPTDVRGFSFVLGVGAGDEPIFSRFMGLVRVEDGKEFLAHYEKYMTDYNKVVEKIDSPIFRPVQCERTEVEGIPSLKATITMAQMPNMPPGGEKMMEAMFGPGGKVTAWIVPCDEHTVLFTYLGKEHLREAIAAVKEGKEGLAEEAGVAKAARLLPKKAVWRFYVSPQGIFEFGKRMIVPMMPPGMNMNIPAFGETPPVALGLVTGENEVELQTIVPAEVLKEAGRLTAHGMGGPIEQ